MGQIIKYNLVKSAGDSRNTTVISGGSPVVSTETNSIDCELWGQRFRGNDINGTMHIYGDIYLDIDEDSDVEDDEEEVNDNPQLDDDDDDEEEITGTLYGNVKGGNLEGENVIVNKHLFVNHTHDKHEGEKVCLIEEVETNTKNIKTNADNIKKNADNIEINKTNIETNKKNIASNLTEINNLKTRVSNNEIAIDSLDENMQNAETAIRNNSEEIAKLKQKTTANETAIQSMMPIGSIIMYNGLAENIPENWAICNGENGTPNLTDKFIKASTTAGQTGGSNSTKIQSYNIPKMQLNVDVTKLNGAKEWQQRLDKKIPVLDKIEEGVYDEGGSSHYALYTGYKKGDNGLLGVNYPTIIDDVRDYTYIGTDDQLGIDTQPEFYSLIFIIKVA